MADLPHAARVDAILAFWFGDDPARPLAHSGRWFERSDAFDGQVREAFAADLEAAGRGELYTWAATPRSALALVVLLDQLSRNIHRDSPLAFAHDARALRCTLEGVERGLDAALTPVERWFFYMPCMHAEDLAVQDRGLALFRALAAEPHADPAVREALQGVVSFAERHRAAIAHCGRFPHRNAVLGRATTPAELAWLAAHPEGF